MKIRTMVKAVAGALSLMLALSVVPAETVFAKEHDAENVEIVMESSRKDAVRRSWKMLNRYQYNADNSVYSHTDYTYDANGNRIGYTRYDGDGTDKIEYVTKSTYDAEGNAIKSESTSYSEDGKVSDYYYYTYNAEGYQTGYESFSYYPNGAKSAYRTSTFDAEGNELSYKYTSYDEDGTVDYDHESKYTYNAKGQIEKCDSYYNGQFDGVQKYTYNEDGKTLKVVCYGRDGKYIISIEEYIYEGKTLVRRNSYYNSNNEMKLQRYNTYKVDKDGNILEESWYNVDEAGKETLERQYVHTYQYVGEDAIKITYYELVDGKIVYGWKDEFGTDGEYARTIYYGEGGKITSFEYSGSLETPKNAKPGDIAYAVNESYDANHVLQSKTVYTYMLFEYGTPDTPANPDLNGLNPANDGNWYKYVNGVVDSNYTGLYCDANYGWWLVVNGRIAFDYYGLYNDAACGWWLVNGGAIDFGYTGLYGDANCGWWLVNNGAVDFGYTGLYGDANYGWWLVNGGAVDFGYTGLYGDAYCGWWLVNNGAVNFSYTGLYGDANYGWWLVNGGAVDFGYTGLYEDPVYGWWKVAGGAVDFGYTGTVDWYGGTYNVVNGCLVF